MLQFWFRKSLKQPTWLIPVLIVLLATLLLNLRAQQVQR